MAKAATTHLDVEAANNPFAADNGSSVTCGSGAACASDAPAMSWRQVLLHPTALLLVGIAAGATVGVLLAVAGLHGSPAVAILGLPGQLWLKSLKCMVLPLIVLSLVLAMVALRSLPGSRRLGLQVIGLYQLTTMVAAANGCIVAALIMGPTLTPLAKVDDPAAGAGAHPTVVRRSLLETILGIFDNAIPKNLVGDAAAGNLLPVIVAAIVFGLLVPDKRDDGVEGPSATLQVVRELDQVVSRVVTFIMKLTPIGVGSLVLKSTSSLNLAEVGDSVGLLFAAVAAGLLLHMTVFYPLLLLLLGRRNPIAYYQKCVPAFMTALGTSSSAATLPVTKACAEKNGVPGHLAGFALSLGATINMDGTGIYLICATFFLATLEGVHFGVGKFLLTAILATVCSMGTAPVPSASLVLLATILTAVGVPLSDSFSLIVIVDWMLDRLRTTVNVAGDLCVVGILAKTAGKDAGVDLAK